MDYQNAPATAVLRQVLFRTPQGWVFWFFSAVNVAAGFLALAYPALASWKLLSPRDFFIFFPIIYLPMLLWFSLAEEFEPSPGAAVFTGIYGVLPFVFPYMPEIVAAKTRATDAANDSVLAIYQASGVLTLPSAWVAALVVWAMAAALIFGAMKAMVWTIKAPGVAQPIRWCIWLVVAVVLVSVVLIAADVTAYVRNLRGLEDDDLFGTYLLVLFLCAIVPVWYVLWRAGLLSGEDEPSTRE